MFCNTNWKGIISFQSSGNVGIGTASPQSKLQIVSGNGTGLQMTYDSSNNYRSGIYTYFAAGDPATTSLALSVSDGTTTGQFPILTAYGDGHVRINNGLLDVVGDIKYSGIIQDTSDRRAKENIQPLPPGQLKKLMQLQPVSFIMKNDPHRRTELGLIAQDVEPLYPELVQTGPDGMKSMGYMELIAPLIKAEQEQETEINQLRAALAFVFFVALIPGFLLWKNRKM